MDAKKEIKGLVEFIRSEVRGAGKTGCIVGVSGGIDSAVVVSLCKLAFPKTTYGILMPANYENIKSTDRARELCVNKKIPYLYHSFRTKWITDYSDGYDYSGNKIKRQTTSKSTGNISARMRMIILYHYAEINDCLVIGTDNLSENFMGYFSKGGDGMVDINPIGKYFKREVYELGKALKVPTSIMKAKPSAELWDGQTDEDEMGFTYDQIEKVIETFKWNPHDNLIPEIVLRDYNISKNISEKILFMHKNTEHKRIIPKEYEREHEGN